MQFKTYIVRPVIEIEEEVTSYATDSEWEARQQKLDDAGIPYRAYHTLYGVLDLVTKSQIADFQSGKDARFVCDLLNARESGNG